MSELSVGDKVILKRAGYPGRPIQVFKVVGVDDNDVDALLLDEQGYRCWFCKTSLIKVGSYG